MTIAAAGIQGGYGVNKTSFAQYQNQQTDTTINTSSLKKDDTFQFSKEAMSLLHAREIGNQDREAYKEIMNKAQETDGYSDPQGFLKSLSPEELGIVKKVNCCAFDIDPDKLDFEGAYNLIVQPGDQADLNSDGVIMHGAASTRPFPPTNAPNGVKNAFAEATAGMEPNIKALMTASFRSFEISANLKYDSSGNAIGVYQPDEVGFNNIYSEADFSYIDLAKKALNNLDSSPQQTGEVLDQMKSFLGNFIDSLERDNSA